jgi:hypothetical protein
MTNSSLTRFATTVVSIATTTIVLAAEIPKAIAVSLSDSHGVCDEVSSSSAD